MKKALIIGSNGYIGRHLALLLNQQGIEVHCCDIHPQSIDHISEYQAIDITDKESIKKLDFQVDSVFVLAGLSGTKIGLTKYRDFLSINELGFLNILNRIQETHSPARVIFPSSRLVYKGQSNTPLTEDAPKELKTIYAVNKWACENYLKIFQNSYGIPYTIFRICVPYGNLIDNTYSYGTIGFLLGKALKGEAITLYGDGQQRRTFTHIEDVCQQMIQASFHPQCINEAYNIGSKDHLSILEVAQKIASMYEVDITHSDWPELDLRIESGDTIFDDTKIQNIIHYPYRHEFKDWLQKVANIS